MCYIYNFFGFFCLLLVLVYKCVLLNFFRWWFGVRGNVLIMFELKLVIYIFCLVGRDNWFFLFFCVCIDN